MKREHNVCKAMLLLGATLLCAGAWAAPLQQEMVTRTETVTFARSHAQTAAGAVKLYRELHGAASRVCRDAGSPFSMLGESYSSCVEGAMAKAVEDVNIAAVSAIYLQNDKVPGKKGIVTVAKR
jgi:UrcA family protein